jgi:endogenous inhibitor of DNA gyrase (YacG/DUF329 family)
MDVCLNCQKELVHVEGRRKKTFCSPTCRNTYWRKHAKKEPRYVLWETHQKVLDELKELKDKVRFANDSPIDYRPTTEQSYDAPKKHYPVQDEFSQVADQNRSEIQRLTAELLNPPKDLKGLDLTIWKREIREKIEQLRNPEQ